MSLAGLHQFKENLDTLMNSQAWREADDCQRLHLGYALLNSRYGGGIWGWWRRIRPLAKIEEPHEG